MRCFRWPEQSGTQSVERNSVDNRRLQLRKGNEKRAQQKQLQGTDGGRNHDNDSPVGRVVAPVHGGKKADGMCGCACGGNSSGPTPSSMWIKKNRAHC